MLSLSLRVTRSCAFPPSTFVPSPCAGPSYLSKALALRAARRPVEPQRRTYSNYEKPSGPSFGTKFLLSGFAERTNERDIAEWAGKFGEVEWVYVCRRKGKSRGEAYIEMSDPEGARTFFRQLVASKMRLHDRYITGQLVKKKAGPNPAPQKWNWLKFPSRGRQGNDPITMDGAEIPAPPRTEADISGERSGSEEAR